MIYREKFYYVALLIKTSDISMCSYIFNIKLNTFINISTLLFLLEKYSKKLLLYLYLNNFKSR